MQRFWKLNSMQIRLLSPFHYSDLGGTMGGIGDSVLGIKKDGWFRSWFGKRDADSKLGVLFLIALIFHCF